MPFRVLGCGCFLVTCLLFVACSGPVTSNKPVVSAGPGKHHDVDIGSPLLAEVEWPRNPRESSAKADPIVIPLCHLTVVDKVDVSSNVDGTVRWLGVRLQDGEVVPPADVYELRGEKYRRLRLGERVVMNEIVVLLDDRQAFVEVETAKKSWEGAINEAKATGAAVTAILDVLKIEDDLMRRGVGSQQAVSTAKTNVAKFQSDHAKAERSVKQAEGEWERGKIKWEQHRLQTAISGEVVQIIKQAGEGVKATETVLQIQDTSRLRVEGYLDLQYASKVKPGSDVFIEPSIMEAPVVKMPFHAGKPVHCIAAADTKDGTLIVSGGEDGMVYVWNPKESFETISWRHGRPVRAIACTKPGVDPMVLTGCDDGKARLYDLSNPSKKELRILDGHHQGGVHAVGFAPGGSKCVTADERGEIYLWQVSTGKLLYQFPHEHSSSVSAIAFLPQGRVVSVGRENVVHIWHLGQKGARIESSFEHRTGDVPALGIAEDGSCMMLDQLKDRMNLIELSEGRTIGTLQHSGEGAKFSTLSAISPPLNGKAEHRLYLSAGATDGILQLWRRLPESRGRAVEFRKLICDGYVPATSAAFSPTAKNGYLAVGTRNGQVMVWKVPTEQEINARYAAKIMHVDRTVESSGKTVRVMAEFDNPKEESRRLRPGTTATIVVPQP